MALRGPMAGRFDDFAEGAEGSPTVANFFDLVRLKLRNFGIDKWAGIIKRRRSQLLSEELGESFILGEIDLDFRNIFFATVVRKSNFLMYVGQMCVCPVLEAKILLL